MAVKALGRPMEQKQVKTPVQSQGGDLRQDWAVKIDYVSICSTALSLLNAGELAFDTVSASQMAIARLAGVGLTVFASAWSTWAFGAGRKQYPLSLRTHNGAVLFYGSDTQAPLLECGGAACDAIRGSGEMDGLIYHHWERVTRIDLAGDLECNVTPEEFLAYGHSARHVAKAGEDSATGSTRYVGSASSDRRLKVYRYFPPHPRARFLRVEVTVRRDLAKSAAAHLADETVPQVWQAACQPFDLKAPQWRLPSSTNRLQRTLKNEPTAASRLRWLITQIKPAVIDAHRTGLIDLAVWLEELDYVPKAIGHGVEPSIVTKTSSSSVVTPA